MIRVVFVSILIVINYGFLKCLNHNTLQLVHVIFRHGERTPDKFTIYPNDPWKDKKYYPEGFGALTNKGKQTMYKLGKDLRIRYNDFLGPIYRPDNLYARSTALSRTKASLLLVLAGLFPPKDVNVWNSFLNWPIPYNYLDLFSDGLLFPLFCGNISFYINEFLSLPSSQEKIGSWSDVYEYLSQHTGNNITCPNDVSKLYFTLTTEEGVGLPQPEWIKNVYPEPMTSITNWNYLRYGATINLKKYMSGNLLSKIINDTKNKINGISDLHERKIFLYSGHEFNVAAILQALGVFKPHAPYYGSNVILEVHKINATLGIKIYYQKKVSGNRYPLVIPHCTAFCPFHKFISIMQDILLPDNRCK